MNTAEFPVLILATLPRLWSFALRLSRDQKCAEALVYRACVRARDEAHDSIAGVSGMTRMFSLIYSDWTDELQHRPRPPDTGALAQWSERQAEPEESSDSDTVFEIIINAVDRLPEPLRVVLLLIYAEGLGVHEAAEVLGVPPGAVLRDLSSATESINSSLRNADPVATTLPQHALTH